MRAETRALNEQETRLATARATAAELQAAAQAAEQARDTAKAQLAALQLDADAVTRYLDESRAQAASPPKSVSPVTRPSSSGPSASARVVGITPPTAPAFFGAVAEDWDWRIFQSWRLTPRLAQ